MRLYDERLHDMLRYKRPHNTTTERDWVARFILSAHPDAYCIGKDTDPAAFVIDIPLPDGSQSRTMFSAHVDTVHREDGRQTIKYDRKREVYYKTDGKPLGADDTAGCWILLEMIDARVPGSYVFHRGEECGGIGSTYIAEHHPEFLQSFDRAIAFDRRGSTDVITHQGWGRCASNEFAEALSSAINEDGISMYMPDDTGVFTDTANYVQIIPECTNVSCGYNNEHTGNETLHLPTLFALRNQCIVIDWENLPTVRDPNVIERESYGTFDWSTWDMSKSRPRYLTTMSKADMLDMAYADPDTFVALVREELFGESMDEYDETDDHYQNVRYML